MQKWVILFITVGLGVFTLTTAPVMPKIGIFLIIGGVIAFPFLWKEESDAHRRDSHCQSWEAYMNQCRGRSWDRERERDGLG